MKKIAKITKIISFIIGGFFVTGIVYAVTTQTFQNPVPIANGGTATTTTPGTNAWMVFNGTSITSTTTVPISTSTYNASITIATALPLGGGASLTNGGTISLTCTGCSTSTGANPTATIGTSVVNGTANTFLRSDGAPALGSQFASSSFAVTNYDATTTAPYAHFLLLAPDYTFTISKFSCQNVAATSTYTIIRATSSVATSTGGTNVVSSIVCGTTSTSTTTFGTSTISAGTFLIALTSSTAGTPTRDELWVNGYKN